MGVGDTVRAAAWVAAVGLVSRHGAGVWQLARTLAWLRHDGEREIDCLDDRPLPEIHVVVPILREQQHVGAALAWWRQILPSFPGMSLTFVSTAREELERNLLARAVSRGGRLTEEEFPQLSTSELADLNHARTSTGGYLAPEVAAGILARTPLTRDVVDRLLAEGNPARIRHLTYPGAGRKAAQINYVAQSLPPGGYLAVYDVDSRPDVELLAATYALLISRPDGSPPMVQQHALHTASHVGRRSVREMVVRGSATLQTVWTLRREIPYARRYQKSASRTGVRARVGAGLSQPVGHGLFVRSDVVTEVGGFPEMTVLDDVPTGVPLTLRGIPTRSLPRLAEVPAPDSVAEVIAQGRRWFCSYLDYPAILQAAARADTGSPAHRRLLWLVATYRGTAWLAASPVTALGVAAALSPRSGYGLRATASAGLFLAAIVPVVMIAAAGYGPQSVRDVSRDAAELLVAYLVRSLGPWLAVGDAVRGRHPTVATAPAPKTHRRAGAVW